MVVEILGHGAREYNWINICKFEVKYELMNDAGTEYGCEFYEFKEKKETSSGRKIFGLNN